MPRAPRHPRTPLPRRGVPAGLLAVALAFPTLVTAQSPSSAPPNALPTTLDMTTWSVVAVDPATGDVGVAVSSCVETFGDGVAALVPGKGAAATQAGFDVRNRNRVFEGLKAGLTAQQIIDSVTDSAWDAQTDRRQYGVVTMADGFVQVAGFTTPLRQGMKTADSGPPRYAGVLADASRGVSAQGNTLAGPGVVQGPLDAYRRDDPAGFNSLPDRLMRAIEAGSIAGGAVRCNRDNIRQTTSMAGEHRHDRRRHTQRALAGPVRAHHALRRESAAGAAPSVRCVATHGHDCERAVGRTCRRATRGETAESRRASTRCILRRSTVPHPPTRSSHQPRLC
jgi:uncharacterized Ntn-hydrolase superfamily protein